MSLSASEREAIHYRATNTDPSNPWLAKCPSCGAKPGKPCYDNGPMPKSMTHYFRVSRSSAMVREGNIKDVLLLLSELEAAEKTIKKLNEEKSAAQESASNASWSLYSDREWNEIVNNYGPLFLLGDC